MIEKKLTDEEIVKAYEHCYVNEGTCKSCCLSDEDKLCVSHEDVLDLITRQKAEIERLTEENEYLDMNAKQFLADYQKSEVEVGELKEAISQTIKDTAKKVIKAFIDEFNDPYRYYTIEYNSAEYSTEETIEDIAKLFVAKKFGVEVE